MRAQNADAGLSHTSRGARYKKKEKEERLMQREERIEGVITTDGWKRLEQIRLEEERLEAFKRKMEEYEYIKKPSK